MKFKFKILTVFSVTDFVAILSPKNIVKTHLKFEMFSNDILSYRIDIKVVTEKTVTNLNLNFKFLFNVKFGSWAFRNCAYFVMKPSGCDTVRLGV